MRNFISKKAGEIKPSGIRKFFDIVNDTKGAISLGVGEPDFITPWNIRDAAITSVKQGYTQYTSNWGLKELRAEISEYVKSRFDLNYDADGEVFVTVGASEAIDVALRAVTDDGDEVLIPDPSYVSYAPCVTLCGGVPVSVPTSAKDEFKLLPEQIESVITPKTKAIIFPYPNNPTGAIMEREYLIKFAEVVKKHDLLVISDEIYAELTYGDKHVSIASIDGMKERTIYINGFSKAFAMTGWRIGYVCAPREFCKAMIKVHQYAIMCAPTFSQYAALNALRSGKEDNFSTVAEMRDEYDVRRKVLLSGLRKAGLVCFEPKGAFYMFPSVKHLGIDGDTFAERLLKEKKVAVVPGSAFGNSGKYHFRCAYAASLKNIHKAIEAIAELIADIKSGR